jgi:beta-mannosidase
MGTGQAIRQAMRRGLSPARWSLCASPTPPATEADWLAMDGPMTAAAALGAAGRWHVDAARRDFDDETWWFRARFDAADDAHVIGLDGIATHAEAWLNGERIAMSTNMFTRHRIDVATLLRATNNELLWIRTTLLGRTPGWSPPAAPVGPWRDVWIGPRQALALDALWLRASVENGEGIVRCRIDAPVNDRMELRLSREGREWSIAVSQREATLRIPQPALWWPHTHGEPAVYEARLLMRESGIDVALPPVGFRTIDIDTSGGNFAVRIHGEPVFCRGAVWTPLDAVSFRSSAGAYAQALAQVREAGMNMLRVAGTTVYEEDAFYEACDRAGVLVWQDFMFANMDYPAGDEAFLHSVRTEVRQQLQRLHAHPCIAVLCGNSEAEQQAAMWGAPRDAWEQPLFHETLPALCEELAPDMAYWPSSAHGGALPQQPDTGTTSYYGVGAYLRPLEDARRSNLKFATECLAFANVPDESTIARMPAGSLAWKERTPRDLGAAWDFEDVRDHYLERLYGVDARDLRRGDAERYLALSRQVTGDVMARAFSEWRRPGSACGGALVLMLRDFRPGAGWGLLDDQGVPKPCWHALKEVLQPVAVLITDEGMNGLHAHVLNETPHPLRATLRLQALRDDVQVADAQRDIEVPARGAITIACALLLDHFMDLNWSHRFGPPPCHVVSCVLLGETGAVLGRARHCTSGQPPIERAYAS